MDMKEIYEFVVYAIAGLAMGYVGMGVIVRLIKRLIHTHVWKETYEIEAVNISGIVYMHTLEHPLRECLGCGKKQSKWYGRWRNF